MTMMTSSLISSSRLHQICARLSFFTCGMKSASFLLRIIQRFGLLCPITSCIIITSCCFVYVHIGSILNKFSLWNPLWWCAFHGRIDCSNKTVLCTVHKTIVFVLVLTLCASNTSKLFPSNQVLSSQWNAAVISQMKQTSDEDGQSKHRCWYQICILMQTSSRNKTTAHFILASIAIHIMKKSIWALYNAATYGFAHKHTGWLYYNKRRNKKKSANEKRMKREPNRETPKRSACLWERKHYRVEMSYMMVCVSQSFFIVFFAAFDMTKTMVISF